MSCIAFFVQSVQKNQSHSTGLSLQKFHAFPAFKRRNNDSTNASLGFLSRTRDSIINYSGERMRPRVKGSFLNARCGLTDSPPCPPTTPPHPTLARRRHSWRRRTALLDLGIAVRTRTNSRQTRFYDYREILWFSFPLILFFFLTGLKSRVTSEFMHSQIYVGM